MKICVEHYRVPDVPFLEQSKKGRPHASLLHRYYRSAGFDDLPMTVNPSVRGGSTLVMLIDEGEDWLVSGKAVCSMSDNYSYAKGKNLALLRATNRGLGHDDMDYGVMHRLTEYFLDKATSKDRIQIINALAEHFKNKTGLEANTVYINAENAEIMPEIDGLSYETSKIILKNHVWVGFEEK